MPRTHTVRKATLTKRQWLESIYDQQEALMSALNDALARLSTEVTEQLDQTATALAGVQTALDQLNASEAEKAELKRLLDEALAANSDAVAAITAQADALAADDPVEEPPVEEPPVEEPGILTS